MAVLVLRAVSEVLKHVFYHLVGSWVEKFIDTAIRKRRRKRNRARTKKLAFPVLGAWIILGEGAQRARVVILVDDASGRMKKE